MKYGTLSSKIAMLGGTDITISCICQSIYAFSVL